MTDGIHVSQIDLMGAISKHLERKCGIKNLRPRQINAIITAANTVVEAMSVSEKPVYPGMGLAAWYESDHVGLSSEFMAFACTNGRPATCHWPRDPDDLGRCISFLDAVPPARTNLHRLQGTCVEWARLLSRWEELESMYRAKGHTVELYDLMQTILKGSE